MVGCAAMNVVHNTARCKGVCGIHPSVRENNLTLSFVWHQVFMYWSEYKYYFPHRYRSVPTMIRSAWNPTLHAVFIQRELRKTLRFILGFGVIQHTPGRFHVGRFSVALTKYLCNFIWMCVWFSLSRSWALHSGVFLLFVKPCVSRCTQVLKIVHFKRRTGNNGICLYNEI